MSRRANNVRGPTSALTEFLREAGINATSIARRAATRAAEEAEANGNEARAEASTAQQENVQPAEEAAPELEPQTNSRRRRRGQAEASGYASDELDEPATPAKKRKLTKAQEAKEKAKAKKAAKKKGEDDSDEDEGDDLYTALSGMRGGGKPPVGSFSNCARCEKQFTVTKYTMAANPGPGWLCHPCAKAGGIDPFKKPAVAPKPKRRRAEDKKSTTFEERRFPSLVSICVQIITRNIDNIEALGDIGTMNMQEISKAISKTRGLTPENVKLFYDAVQSKLTLYDATNLPSAAFSVMGALNPRLTTLRLDFCGQMDSAALDALSSHLPELKNIELLGPFLVRTESWQRFFQNHQLEEFLITQSPRFDLACLRALLASSGKSLRRLRLREVGKLNDKFINELCSLRDAPLQHLDLAHPSHSCSEDALIDLVKAVGSDLRYLDFSAHDELSDVFLTEGLAPHCHHVATLILQHLPLLTDAGVAGFFANYHCTPLTTLDLSRNPDLSSAALAALLAHSGSALERLSINGWKDTKHEALMEIGARAKELREVDVGWCREVDDFVVKAILEGGEDGVRPEHLQKVWVWGCGRVKGVFPRRPGVSVFGVEAHQVGGE